MKAENKVAVNLAEEALVRAVNLSTGRLRKLLDDKEVRVVAADDGRNYNVETYCLPDEDGFVRVLVAVEDGGFFSSLKPITRDEIVSL